MRVFGKLMYGSAHLLAYDLHDPSQGEGAASLVVDTAISIVDIMIATPESCNIHELTATTDCCLLDIMAPPYHVPKREASYYRVERKGSAINLLPTYPHDYVCIELPYRGPLPILSE